MGYQVDKAVLTVLLCGSIGTFSRSIKLLKWGDCLGFNYGVADWCILYIYNILGNIVG